MVRTPRWRRTLTFPHSPPSGQCHPTGNSQDRTHMSMEGSSHLGKALDLRRAKCEPDLPPHSVHPPGPKCPEPLSAKGPSVWKPSLPSLCSPSQFLHCFLRTRFQRTYSLNARGALTRRGLLREPRALSKALRSGRWGKGAPETSVRPSRFCSLLG